MTQKEMLYIEDAIGHETNIIAICNETINMLDDKKLKTFIESELKKHKSTREKLINKLKECSND